MITDERLKELMASVGMPESKSLYLALRQCDMEADLRNKAENAKLIANIEMLHDYIAGDSEHMGNLENDMDKLENERDKLLAEREMLQNNIEGDADHIKSLEGAIEKLLAEREQWMKQDQELLQLGMDQPWPMLHCVKKLIECADILLNEKRYDRTGHEYMSEAMRQAKNYIATWHPLPAQQVPEDLENVLEVLRSARKQGWQGAWEAEQTIKAMLSAAPKPEDK